MSAFFSSCPSSPLRLFDLISLFNGVNQEPLPPRFPTSTDRREKAEQMSDMGGVLVTPLSPHCQERGSILRVMRMAKYTTPTIGQIRSIVFISHIHAQPRGRGHHTPCRPHRGCTQGQSEPGAVGGGRLCGIQRVGSPLVPTGGCDRLV